MLSIDDVRASRSAVITIKDAASLLGCNPRTVTAALSIHGGDIPARRVGRRVVIPRVQWLAWLDGQVDVDEAAPLGDDPVRLDTTAIVRAKLLQLLAELEGAG